MQLKNVVKENSIRVRQSINTLIKDTYSKAEARGEDGSKGKVVPGARIKMRPSVIVFTVVSNSELKKKREVRMVSFLVGSLNCCKYRIL